MNNFIIISKTFEEINPESCEDGDFSDRGFIDEILNVSFSELVDLMKNHNECSCSPNDYNINNWYSTGFYTSDYRTCTERNENIHFHQSNTLNAAKYWELARLFADKNN